jgi:hypothetical protein
MSKRFTYYGSKSGVQLLFDLVPNGVLGISVFNLSSLYTGDCMLVEKVGGGGGTTLIGFVNNYLDVASLLTFSGGNQVVIREWYSSDGSGRFAFSDSVGQSPMIVDNSGNLVTENGIAAPYFDGTNDFMKIADFSYNLNQLYRAVVARPDTTSDNKDVFAHFRTGGFQRSWLLRFGGTRLSSIISENGGGTNSYIFDDVYSTQQYIVENQFCSFEPVATQEKQWLNGIVNDVRSSPSTAITSLHNSTAPLTLGSILTSSNNLASSNNFEGKASEFLMFNGIPNRTDIFNNINSRFNIP